MTTAAPFHATYSPRPMSGCQKRLLQEIAHYWRRSFFSPSIRDLQEATGTSSSFVVHYNLHVLEHRRLLTMRRGISRSIVLTDAGWALSGHDRPCCS